MTDITTTDAPATPKPKAKRHILPLVRELRHVAEDMRAIEAQAGGPIIPPDLSGEWERLSMQEDALLESVLYGRAVNIAEGVHQIAAALDYIDRITASGNLAPEHQRILVATRAGMRSALKVALRPAGLTVRDLWSDYGIRFAAV